MEDPPPPAATVANIASRALLDVVLDFDRFQNVDLFRRGRYQLRTIVYAAPSASSKQREYAAVDVLPTSALPTTSSMPRVALSKGHGVFVGRPWTIQFEREVVALAGDRVKFQLDMSKVTEQDVLVMVLELWHSSDMDDGCDEADPTSYADRVQKRKLILGKLKDIRESAPTIANYILSEFKEPCFGTAGLAVSTYAHGKAHLDKKKLASAISEFYEVEPTQWSSFITSAVQPRASAMDIRCQAAKSQTIQYLRRFIRDASAEPTLASKCSVMECHRRIRHEAKHEGQHFVFSDGHSKTPTLLLFPAGAPSTFPLRTPRIRQEVLLTSADTDTQSARHAPPNTFRHLIVFVHGIDGCSRDFRKLRNILTTCNPSTQTSAGQHLYLLAKSNERDSFADIAVMGANLAEEVRLYYDNNGGDVAIGKVSFVCYSLGGIIARTAIEDEALAPIRNKLDTFVTLAAPHLGLLYHDSVVLQQVISLARTVKKSAALAQLNLADRANIRDGFFYKLTGSTQALRCFRRVLLVASPQDHYVPYASAMCELDRRALDDREQGSAHVEMLNRIMAVGGLDPARVDRVQVVFDGAKADDPLGRNAHLYFVQNERFLMQLAMCVDWFL